MTTITMGTMTSQMIPHQSRLYIMNLLVVFAPSVAHIPLPLTRCSPSSILEALASSFKCVELDNPEESIVLPIAFGVNELFFPGDLGSSSSEY